MKKIATCLILVLLFSLLSPFLEGVHITKDYSYASEQLIHTPDFTPAQEPTAGLSDTKSIQVWKEATEKVVFEQPKNMISLRIPKTNFVENEEQNFRITLHIPGKDVPLTFDLDNNENPADSYYTEPVFFDPIQELSYTIAIKNTSPIPFVGVIGLDTNSGRSRIAIETPKTSAQGVNIISRSTWGADENFRYKDSPTWKSVFERIEANKDQPKSDATIQYEQRLRDMNSYLAKNFAEQDLVVETIRNENGHDLVWPIQKTKKVERIIIHHTADDNRTEKDDLAMIRGIYYYHTVVRGWGDIGYNYLVGQRGQIYEGRAGGDYAAGAHAVWNNKSSVGVSVMGNFMQDSVVLEQEEAVKSMIEYLSIKYGIDLQGTSMGHKECKKGDCLLTDFSTPNLSGHREVGFTSCPGDNLFTIIESVRKNEAASRGRIAIINPRYSSTQIASLGSEDQENNTQTKVLNKGPNVKIRLSYTGSSITLKSGDSTLPRLVLGTASGALKKNLELTFEPSGTNKIALSLGKKKYPFSRVEFSAQIVSITNWSRKPSWDTSGTMNDNVFRGKLILLNEGGKLVVVNELPLEDYLRGIAEVSNGDNTEKIKTILVAARSYAYFYSFPENRKFPGKSYDGSDNPDEFQKYLGYGYEKRSPNSSKLVDETNGQIITYEKKPIKPWYFSESSGQTLSYTQYCEKRRKEGSLPSSSACTDIPYLQSVTDPGGVGRSQKGHGVGISGIGSTYLAINMEMTYKQIIQYFLTGVDIEKKY